MFWTNYERYGDLGLLIARLGFGLGFFWFHGWPKLIGGPERWERVGAAMRNFSIDVGARYWGFCAALAESSAGCSSRPACSSGPPCSRSLW